MIEVINIKSGRSYDHYIGRSPKGQPDNLLSNPFKIRKDGNRIEVIQKFILEYFIPQWINNPEFRDAVTNLDGRLGCFCHPEACHGDVYKVFLETLSQSTEDEAIKSIYLYLEELKGGQFLF